MKSSYYNIFFPFGDDYILFNTLRGTVFEVDSEMKNALEKNDISLFDEDLKEVFKEHGIVIDDDVNERDQVALMVNGTWFNVTTCRFHIITVYDSNISCTYCHEGEENKYMDEKTAEYVIGFIKDTVSRNNSSTVDIELSGGEPLLNMPVNVKIVENLSEWCKKTNREFSLKVITNGTLLTSERVEWLADHAGKVVTVLDGPRDIHDQRRMYKNGGGTFDDIIEGLTRVRERNLEAVVQINVDESNKGHVVPLLEFLTSNFGVLGIFINPITNTFPSWKLYSRCIPGETAKVQELINRARTMNFAVESEMSLFQTCLAHKISCFTIDPYLRLFRCTALPPFEGNSVGVLSTKDSNPIFNRLNIDFLSRAPLLIDECKDCTLLPVCGGGCPAQALVTLGTPHKRVCNKPEIYETLKNYLICSLK